LLGGLGEAGGQVLGKTLGSVVPTTASTKELMKRGVVPTMGQGADPNTWRGAALKMAEDMSQYAPVSGTTIRSARDRASREVLDEATRIVDPTVGALPKSAQKVVEQLRNTTSEAYKKPLHDVKAFIDTPTASAFASRVDDLSKQFSLNPRDTARIKAELDTTLSGVRGGVGSLNVLENLAKDLAGSGTSEAERQVYSGLSKYIRSGVDALSEQAGKPLAPARAARAGYHVVKKAVPSKAAGVSGEQLLSAIRKNDEKMGAMLTPELRQLAEQAQSITPAARAYGATNPARALTGALDIGAGFGTGGLSTAALLGYGKAQGGNLAKLLMGDEATQKAFAEALRNPAIAGVLLGTSGE
jgi:hypothetical protein